MRNTDEMHAYFQKLSMAPEGQLKLRLIMEITPLYFSGENRFKIRHSLYVGTCLKTLRRIAKREKLSIHLIPSLIAMLRNTIHVPSQLEVARLIDQIASTKDSDASGDRAFYRAAAVLSADEYARALDRRIDAWQEWYRKETIRRIDLTGNEDGVAEAGDDHETAE